ncbi:hypothetical protein [Synechococcus phage DSL-LC02]|nr:hypothetical protein [Synechococcus phage DSL-LC02]
MIYQVTEIEFDFTDDCNEGCIPNATRQEIIDEVLRTYWDSVDEEDLVEEITCATGWCIKSLNYRHVLS